MQGKVNNVFNNGNLFIQKSIFFYKEGTIMQQVTHIILIENTHECALDKIIVIKVLQSA